MLNLLRCKMFISFPFLLVWLCCSYAVPKAAAIQPDINTILMKSTFKVLGANDKIGTVFILGLPGLNGRTSLVLVTAAHVLQELQGEAATLLLRRKEGDRYLRKPFTIKIRKNGRAVWVKHPSADVAAMYVALPKSTDLLLASTNLLATDEVLTKYDIYPGRELKVLGFPFGLESHEAGFPVLRTGSIASFPLTPSLKEKTFLMDFEVFGGNSGGPVYFHDPDWHKRGSGGVTSPIEVQMIVGLVSRQRVVTERVASYMEETIRHHQTSLAEIVHASLIKETIDLLPGSNN